jgi:hypothetical protein
MEPITSNALKDYYAIEHEALAKEPAVRAELITLNVARVEAEYDGAGDSGQIEAISFRDASGAIVTEQVSEQTRGHVESLLYALLNLRHGGWENNDGAFGSFGWDLSDGSMDHVHHARYTDHDTSVHRGFETGSGEAL